ncbi:MAG: ComEC/Rec2 family competence protein [Christensenellales bacterium]|jgi:competence protein ComEC
MRKRILQVLAMVLLIGVLGSLIYGLDQLDRPDYDPQLKLAFVGTADEADCIVLWQNDFAMMIDTGEERDSEAILAFLAEQGIEKLHYLVLTHPDKDHIGSAAAVTKALSVGSVIQPFYQDENDANHFLQARLAQNRAKIVVPSRVLHYTINDMDIFIYPPMEKKYREDNNYSLTVLVKHGNVSMLFPGDAENKRIAELMRQDWGVVDLYKLPHHGRESENAEALFASLEPAYAVVTAEKASQRMTDIGDALGVEWFFTLNNTVKFVSDGTQLTPVD